MADFPAFLTFEQVVDHLLHVMGLDEFDILDLLNEHARAGNLHVTGKDAEFIDDVPHIFAQGQEFAQRQKIRLHFLSKPLPFPLIIQTRGGLYRTASCCARRTQIMFDRDYAPMYQRYPGQLPTRAYRKGRGEPKKIKMAIRANHTASTAQTFTRQCTAAMGRI